MAQGPNDNLINLNQPNQLEAIVDAAAHQAAQQAADQAVIGVHNVLRHTLQQQAENTNSIVFSKSEPTLFSGYLMRML